MDNLADMVDRLLISIISDAEKMCMCTKALNTCLVCEYHDSKCKNKVYK